MGQTPLPFPGAAAAAVWSAEQGAFLRWLALPKRVREPKTQVLLAADLGVDPATLTRWKALDGWEDALRAAVRSSVFQSPTVQLEVLESLVKEAKRGSFYHQRLYLEMAGIYNPKGVAGASVTILYGVQDSDI